MSTTVKQLGALALVAFAVIHFSARRSKRNLDHIPTVGFTGILSYYDAYRFVWNAKAVLQEGYKKFSGNAFKVPLADKWMVVIANPDLVNELRSARDNDLSFGDAIALTLQTKYTLGSNMTDNTYHTDIVRLPMTRSLDKQYGEMHDEILCSFEELIPCGTEDWVPIPALSTVQKVVCRATNRVLLGLPICRDPVWVDLNIRYTVEVVGCADIIKLVPSFLKPLVGRLIEPKSHALGLGRKLLEAKILERLRMDDELGVDYDERPNDAISWLLAHAKGEERTIDNLITRILFMNVAAIHTSSFSFTQALFNLATYPEYAAPMREEVLLAVEQHGWTRAALNQMVKLDSFLRETSRHEGNDGVMIYRLVNNPSGYTFANGLHLPQGTFVGVGSYEIHHNPSNYQDPNTFDGFRFSKMCKDGSNGTKYQYSAPSLEYLHFGVGRHACPGRFFASTELKTMLAHVLMTYDVALEANGQPASFWFSTLIMPNPNAKILFRRRKI